MGLGGKAVGKRVAQAREIANVHTQTWGELGLRRKQIKILLSPRYTVRSILRTGEQGKAHSPGTLTGPPGIEPVSGASSLPKAPRLPCGVI